MSTTARIAPRATARLQLHAGFTLDDAALQVDYHARLGVSHLYLSPVGCAVPGSTHGYDNIDPTRVNPELGGETALRALSDAARAHGLGLLLDIVPNHMAAHPGNTWWMDLLRHGRDGRHGAWFDVDWDAPGAGGRLLLPVLDRPLEQAIADGLLRLEGDDAGGWMLRHHDQVFPLAPGSVRAPRGAGAQAWAAAINAGTRRGEGALQALLERQHYRLIWWRAGNDRCNYRRFFDITSLVALRCERADVFRAVHALPLRLLAEGVIDGVRVDHVDGLTDPSGYVQRLRRALDAAGARRGLAAGEALLYVEKILAPDETLPARWPCHGTTGYDFMDQVGALLHDPAGEAPLASLWTRAGGEADAGRIEREARADILRGTLQAEFDRSLRRLLPLAAAAPATADLSVQMWARALFALCMHFPVYRTYATAAGLDPADRHRLDQACAAALATLGPGERLALQAISGWLSGDTAIASKPGRDALQRFRTSVEQLTAPLNAKAVEDTTFYRHGVLLSRNEVGSHPAHFALDGDGFHRACLARAERHPLALLATATHDHKRGEDTRARLAVLSRRPDWWAAQVERFERHVPAPLGETVPAWFRAMLWQTLVAAWPLQGGAADDAHDDRMRQWATKALREGKQASSWTDPDTRVEQGSDALVALATGEAGALRAALADAAAELGVPGARNGLVQTLFKLTCPGVPDLYQGSEGWDLSLVDPDNRRPVDYRRRRAWLDDARGWDDLLRQWQDGAVKARLIARLLAVRATHPALFAGDYLPVDAIRTVSGPLLSFRRSGGDAQLWVGALLDAPLPDAHGDGLLLPLGDGEGHEVPLPRGTWRNLLNDSVPPLTGGRRVATSTLFARSPIAVWATL